MKNSIKQELTSYISEAIEDIKRCDGGMGDLHHDLFNAHYYIIGYYDAEQWLIKHQISAFTAIGIVQDYEKEHFGECRTYDNAEKTVNMLAYIYGEELLNEMGLL